jgi:hypothetical protein
MKISKEAALKLKNDLPPGSWREIQKRVKIASGIEYSRSMIYSVLNPDDLRENDLILDEAIALRNELAQKKAAREAAIFS